MPPHFMTTAKIARAVNVHPNTVRYYEASGYLPTIPRTDSGYRRFTNAHLEQMRLAHLALQGPFPGGRTAVETLVHRAADGDLGGALELAFAYLTRVRAELVQADAAVDFLERWSHGSRTDSLARPLRISEAARLLGLTVHTLRNWERDGLIDVPRDDANGYRVYDTMELGRLRVIRMLRLAGYSPMAVLRMLLQFDADQKIDLRHALDTPHPDDEVYSAGDQWLTVLKAQEQRAHGIIRQLEKMIEQRQHTL